MRSSISRFSTRLGPTVAGTLCLIMLGGASAASALSLAPPGHAGTSQYFETIPTSSGNAAPPNGSGSGAGRAAGTTLERFGRGLTGQRQLSHLGSDGRAAAALAGASAPAPVAGSSAVASRRAGEPRRTPGPGADAGGSAAGGVASVLSGDDAGGLGILLPILMALSLFAAAGAGLSRRRAGRDSSGRSA